MISEVTTQNLLALSRLCNMYKYHNANYFKASDQRDLRHKEQEKKLLSTKLWYLRDIYTINFYHKTETGSTRSETVFFYFTEELQNLHTQGNKTMEHE